MKNWNKFSDQSFADAPKTHALVLRLAKALHQYGTPAHRLEQAVERVAESLDVLVQIFSMPTGLFMSFIEEEGQETYLLRVSPGELYLEKQCDIDELADHIISGSVSPAEAHEILDSIKSKPERYAAWLGVLAFGVTGASVMRLFNGGLNDITVAGLGGLISGFVAIFFARFEQLRRLIPAIASFSVALFVAFMASYLGPIAQSACHVSAVMILLPGLSLTVAMTELSTQNLVSGTARIAGSLEVLMQIGFGLALGNYGGEYLFGSVAEITKGTLPEWTFWFSLVAASSMFVILFRTRPKDFIWMLLAGSVAMFGSKLGLYSMGPRLGPFVGAMMVGLASNLFARLRHRPASLILVPGIILLVPGSLALNSVSAMLDKDVIGGLDTAFTMLMVAISLVFGLLTSSLLISPRRSL